MRQLVDDSSTPLVPAGLSYSPFGVPQSGALPAPFGFTGELHHGGLQYLRARWYDPGEGVLLGRDPFAGYPTYPYSQHYYQYGYANPVLYVDPTGEQVCIAEWVPLIGQEGCVPILVTHTDTVLDGTQLVLDGAGLFPLLGEAADGLNGCISLARGDLTGASLSFTAMVPFVGWGAAATKLGRKGLKYSDSVPIPSGGRAYFDPDNAGIPGLGDGPTPPSSMTASDTVRGADEAVAASHWGSDPLRKYGSAITTHPEEYAAALNELREAGVQIIERPGTMAYSPITGQSGQIFIDPEMSIGALRHEMRHFRDIRDAGYPGMGPYFEDVSLFIEIERRGYMEEINYARRIGDTEAEQILTNLMEERIRHLQEQFGGN